MPYTPGNGTLSNKPYSLTIAAPVDGRSYFYDATNFKWRPYQSTAEVLSELNTTTKRTGHFDVWINIGGTLNGDGSFTGGTYSCYSFKSSTLDAGLVEKLSLTSTEFQDRVATATASALAGKADLTGGKVASSQLPVVNLSSTDFTGTGGTSTPIKINTQVILSYLQSLPGYANDGSLSLKADMTWSSSGTSATQLATPSLVAGTPTSTSIPLTWDAVTDATGYTLDRSINNTTWTNIYTGSGTSYTSAGLGGSTLYYYRLRATAPGFTSSLYSTTSATTAATGVTPSYLTWTPGADMEVYNSAKGMRKKSSGTAGWNAPSLAASTSQATQTLSFGDQVVVKIDNASLATSILLSTGTSPNMNPTITGIDYGIYSGYALGPVAKVIQASSQSGVVSLSIASGDLLRMTYGSQIIFEQSTNNGSSWTTFYTSTIAPSGTYNVFVQSYSPLGGYSEIFKA